MRDRGRDIMGLAEPMTVATDLLLGGVAFVLAARLAYDGVAEAQLSRVALGIGLLASAVAALFGAVAHASDAQRSPRLRGLFFRLALLAAAVAGAAAVAAVAYFAAEGQWRSTVLWAVGAKLAVFTIAVMARARFRVAGIESALSLVALLAGAVYAYVMWRIPAAPWIVSGVAVALLGAAVQARRVAPHPSFNHNDLYHVVMIVALALIYRGGITLVDR